MLPFQGNPTNAKHPRYKTAVRTLQARPARARLPACDVPERPVSELLPAGGDCRRAPCPARADRAGGGAAFRESVAAQHVGRHALLSARLVHDEVQPEAERARCAACRASPICIPISRKRRCRACCKCCSSCRSILPEISGLPACSLQPAAGAHGELTALLVAAAYFRDRIGRGVQKRTTQVLDRPTAPTAPTRPAPTMAGFDTVTVKTHHGRHARYGRLPPPSSTTRSPCS